MAGHGFCLQTKKQAAIRYPIKKCSIISTYPVSGKRWIARFAFLSGVKLIKSFGVYLFE
jgi:hypothetical protein